MVYDASADSLLSSKVARLWAKKFAAKNFAARWLRMSRVFVCFSVLPQTALLSLLMMFSRHFDLSKKTPSMKNLSMMMSLSTHATATIPSG